LQGAHWEGGEVVGYLPEGMGKKEESIIGGHPPFPLFQLLYFTAFYFVNYEEF
jgi:hypothetical protein